jgi:hypothetical protein
MEENKYTESSLFLIGMKADKECNIDTSQIDEFLLDNNIIEYYKVSSKKNEEGVHETLKKIVEVVAKQMKNEGYKNSFHYNFYSRNSNSNLNLNNDEIETNNSSYKEILNVQRCCHV